MNYTKIHQSLRVRIVAFVANLLGVQFKIDGFPFGASYHRSMWMQHRSEPVTGIGSPQGSLLGGHIDPDVMQHPDLR